jgi:glycogen debranching enzyme
MMLVAGQTFCLSGQSGEIVPASPHGLFVGDTRVISGVRLTRDGEPLEILGVAQETPWQATFVGRTEVQAGNAHPAVHSLLVVRRRTLDPQLSERIELRNHGDAAVTCTVRLDLVADFADLFAVKEGRARRHGTQVTTVEGLALRFRWVLGAVRRETAIVSDPAVPATPGAPPAPPFAGTVVADDDGFTWTVTVEGHAAVAWSWHVEVSVGGRSVGRSLGPLTKPPRGRAAKSWDDERPRLDTDDTALVRAYRRAVFDLGSLRLFDPEGRRRPVVAAGAPWFMTLFGRDALWTAYMALPVDPTLALGVLEALAELQGDEVDGRTEEEPGRIMHETRFDGANTLALEGGTTYYGSVDATPLFVVVLGELARWGLPATDVARLLPHADRALAWIEDFGDRDGDGYVEYLRANPRGLSNQGWKDSWDALRYRDGRLGVAPIALCEVQAYVYAAYWARADLAEVQGDDVRAARWRRKAAALKQRFNEDFWVDELGWFAMGLDREKRPIDALASNQGHCLWAGIVDDEHAAEVTRRLVDRTMWTGWGIRTLAADEVAYDPTSYHCGSVWPHDTAIATAGVARYGRKDETFRLIAGLLDAADRADGRLSELFLGLSREDVANPVPYPTSCSPQAWSAASPLLLLRVLLGLHPDVPRGRVAVAPALPPETAWLQASGLRLWDATFDVACDDGGCSVSGLPPHLGVG